MLANLGGAREARTYLLLCPNLSLADARSVWPYLPVARLFFLFFGFCIFVPFVVHFWHDGLVTSTLSAFTPSRLENDGGVVLYTGCGGIGWNSAEKRRLRTPIAAAGV